MPLRSRTLRAAGVALACGLAAGCAATKTSNTGRTAMEQLLISNAVDQSLDKVDFRPLAGRSVFLDTAYTDCTDKNYVVAATRDRILKAGASLTAKPEEAEVVVELRSGAVGTDQSESYVGIPEVAVPGPFPVAIPQIKFWSRNRQTATAKLGLVAFEAKSRTMLGRGGTTLARSDDSNTYFLGMGPYQSGTVREEVSTQLGRPAPKFIPQHVAFGPLQGQEPARFRLASSDDRDPKSFEDAESFEGVSPPPAPAPTPGSAQVGGTGAATSGREAE
jgi:hypothetical protein